MSRRIWMMLVFSALSIAGAKAEIKERHVITIEAAGTKPTATNFYLQRNLERRYGKVKPMDKKVFSHGTREGLSEGDGARKAVSAIAKENLPKYQRMSEMKTVRSGEGIEQKTGRLHMTLRCKDSSIRFPTLTPNS